MQEKAIIILIVMIAMLINANNNVAMLIIRVLIKEIIIKFVHYKIIVKMYKDINIHLMKKINYVFLHVMTIHGINYIIWRNVITNKLVKMMNILMKILNNV